MYRFAFHQNPPGFRTACALQHFMGIDSSFANFRILEVEFGKSWNGAILLIYLQSSCGSPFLGKYVGTVKAEHYWMSILLRGKELMINQQGQEAKYPRKIPSLFQSAPIEDYDKDICDYLCKNEKKGSWESHHSYKFNTCEMNDFTDAHDTYDKLCSPNDCHFETVFASVDYFVEYLRWDETNLTGEQHQNVSKMRNYTTAIWIKSDCSFFTIKNINIEKKFEEFLAEIGGNFGLFVGASILTLVEMGVFFFKICKGIVFDRRGLKKSNTHRIEEGKV